MNAPMRQTRFFRAWHDQNLQVNGDKNHGTILGT